MNQTLRVAVIGLGRVSGGHLQGWQACENAEIVALCDVAQEKITAAQKRHDLHGVRTTTNYTDLLTDDDVDAVDFCLPDYLHKPACLSAAEAGKHILCEKPLGMTADEASEMLAAVEAVGVTNQIRFQRRNSRLINYARHLVQRGDLGAIRHFRARLAVHRISDPAVKLEWRLQADQGCYGALGDLGAHALDTAFFVLGDSAGEVVDASALSTIFIHAREYEDGRGTGEVTGYDAIDFSLRYEHNVLGSYQLTRFAPGTDEWEIDGEHASIRGTGFSTDSFLWFERAPRDDQIPASQLVERKIPDEFPQIGSEFEGFANAALRGEPATPDFNDGLRVARVLDQVAASAAR